MDAPLADTNIVSELARKKPDPAVLRWAADIATVAVSAITVEEIRFGLSWRPNARVEDWFQRFLEESCEVLPVTREIAVKSGELRGRLRADGRPRTQADMLIAATAHVRQRVLVTRNARDFHGCGLALLDPFA
jgi:predicted nucleic acid-binding protein